MFLRHSKGELIVLVRISDNHSDHLKYDRNGHVYVMKNRDFSEWTGLCNF